MEMDLVAFALSKFRSPFVWERRRAEADAREILNQLHQAGEIDLAECLLEAMRGKEEELLFQFPEVLERFKGWWEWEAETAEDDYHWDNRRDRAATGTTVKFLG